MFKMQNKFSESLLVRVKFTLLHHRQITISDLLQSDINTLHPPISLFTCLQNKWTCARTSKDDVTTAFVQKGR